MPHYAHVRAASDEFWHRAGTAGTEKGFPRNLEEAVMLALPAAVTALPELQLTKIERWLRAHNVAYRFHCANRGVRGCLVAYRGQGIIFVDNTDPAGEIRLTIAHEAAHFLEDYLRPREEAIKRLGPDITAVLDSDRPPTMRERVHAALAGTHLAFYYNYMERDRNGEAALSDVWDAEDHADQLALELVAPADEVREHTSLSHQHYLERRSEIAGVLTTIFGLPTDMADLYGRALLQSLGKGPSFLEQLGLRSPL